MRRAWAEVWPFLAALALIALPTAMVWTEAVR
jgi:hypothetical protein